MKMSVTHFKAHCLGVIDQVQKEKVNVTLTRHGKPAAELIPVFSTTTDKLFGRSRKSTVIEGDLLTTGESWDAEN